MPSSIALLFPGQGSHAEGMDEPYRGHPLFERGLELLGHDPFERPRRGHPLPAAGAVPVLGRGVGPWRARGDGADDAGEAIAAAGHSLGEYAALVAAGALGFDDAVKLVDERADAMAAAGEQRSGGMIAMLGGESRDVRALADRLGLVVANDNAPGQLVLSGPVDALDAAEEVAREETGARARRLDVTGAFHSPLMEPAADRLRAALESTPVNPMEIPVYSNGTAAPFVDMRARAGREPAAPRALARDAARPAHRRRRALRRARPRRRAHRPRQADPGGGVTAATASEQRARADGRRAAAPAPRRAPPAPPRPDRRHLRRRRRAARARGHEPRHRRAARHERRVDRPAHRHPRAPHPRARPAARPSSRRAPARSRSRTPAARAAEVDQIIVSTITPDRVTPASRRTSRSRSAPSARAPSTSTPRAPASSTRSIRPPPRSSPAARASCSCAAPRRCRASPTTTTAARRCCSATAPARWSSPAASSRSAAAASSSAPTPRRRDMLYAEREEPKLRMEGREVYRHAIRRMVEATSEAIAARRADRRRRRPLRRPPGERPHPHRRRQRARAAAREGHGQHRPGREHVVGLDPARAGRRRARRAG